MQKVAGHPILGVPSYDLPLMHGFPMIFSVGLLCTAALTPAKTQTQDEPAKNVAPDTAVSYRELYRPQFHFTPPRNWINDPNGLVHYQGEYHLFYQHNPFGDKWGHMSWGHAVSKDLLHWQHLPVAIPEDPSGFMIFSGTVVVDSDNTSRLSGSKNPNDKSCLVAVYTANFEGGKTQKQHLAYSNDRGRTWTQYAGNPVLDVGKKDFRDPKIFRYKNRWIMVVALPTEHKVSFYESANLLKWEHLSDFGPEGKIDEIWECPDLYELPVTADKNNAKKWVLQLSTQSSMQYFIGDFDGKTFTNDNPKEKILRLDHGPDLYAAIVYNNLPASANGHISVGWMNSWNYADGPTSPWRGAMTVPRVHTLKSLPEGIRLIQRPVSELNKLRTNTISVKNVTLRQANDMIRKQKVRSKTAEIVIELEPNNAVEVGVLVRKGKTEETRIGFQAIDSVLFVDRTKSGVVDFNPKFSGRYAARLAPTEGRIKLQILVDWSSVEVFANDGLEAITCQVFPQPTSDGIELYADKDDVKVLSLEISELKSVWENYGKATDKPAKKPKAKPGKYKKPPASH